MSIVQELPRYAPRQGFLHGQRRLAPRQAGPVGHPEDMCIDGNRGLPESGVEYDVGRLAADTGQGLERLSVVRHLPVVFLQQKATGGDDVFCLAVVKTDGLDVIRQTRLPEVKNGLGGICDRKEFRRRPIDAFVRGLCRENHGDEKLKRCGSFEFRSGRRIRLLESAEDLGSLLPVHDGAVRRRGPRGAAPGRVPRSVPPYDGR